MFIKVAQVPISCADDYARFIAHVYCLAICGFNVTEIIPRTFKRGIDEFIPILASRLLLWVLNALYLPQYAAD